MLTGVGLGLRACHIPQLLKQRPALGFLEILVDNILYDQGALHAHLEALHATYPFTFHAVGMSIASTDQLNISYLLALKKLIQRYQPLLVSDHLSWSRHGGAHVPDLLPFPYTEETLHYVAGRVNKIQDILERPLVVENPSSYLEYRASTMSEALFLKSLQALTGCGLLLDVNNVVVSAFNHDWDPVEYMNELRGANVHEIHLAGFEALGHTRIDTHGDKVHPETWALYEYALAIFGVCPTLIEWDTQIPSLDILLGEVQMAQNHQAQRSYMVATTFNNASV